MILESKGKIEGNLYAIGNADLPAFLWKGKSPVLFDAGMTVMGPAYFKDLQTHLGDAARLRYLLLTHSHYDHCGAAPFLKRRIPGLKIGASSKAGEVLKRPSAIQMIRDLNKEAEENFASGNGKEDVFFDKLDVDLFLEDGAEIDLGEDGRIQVIATPGHTRDSNSYYLVPIKTLICGEAAGSFNRDGSIRPQFLASYLDYMDSLEKMSKMGAEIIILAHFQVLKGESARGHFPKIIAATLQFRERVAQKLDKVQGNLDAAVKEIHREDFIERKIIQQEERPYLINLTAQVKAIAEGK